MARFVPGRSTRDTGATIARRLTLAVESVDVGDLDVEGLLDGVAHVDLGGPGSTTKT